MPTSRPVFSGLSRHAEGLDGDFPFFSAFLLPEEKGKAGEAFRLNDEGMPAFSRGTGFIPVLAGSFSVVCSPMEEETSAPGL